MSVLNALIINFVRSLRILLQYAQSVKVKKSRLEKGKYQNIDVTTVATNLMIQKRRLCIERHNKKKTMADNTLILMNKVLMWLSRSHFFHKNIPRRTRTYSLL
jgi:hypothetical protein